MLLIGWAETGPGLLRQLYAACICQPLPAQAHFQSPASGGFHKLNPMFLTRGFTGGVSNPYSELPGQSMIICVRGGT